MAMRRSSPSATAEPWAAPNWPARPPDPARVRVAYGALADGLVVRFDGTAGRPTVAVAIETPDRDDVYALADEESGAVVGVQVDDLGGLAGNRHPAWRRLTETAPPVEAVDAFLADVATLFRRYGAGETRPAA